MDILDRKEERMTVRLHDGRLGVTDAAGKVLMRFPKWERLEFADHDFLKATSRGMHFFVDSRSRQVFTALPQVLKYGSIEVLCMGGVLYTRTRRMYEVVAGGYLPTLADNGSYLMLPRREGMNECPLIARRVKAWLNAVCVVAGDYSRYYWKYRALNDGTVVVMDERGTYYHVKPDAATSRGVKSRLGMASTPSEEECIDLKIHDLEEDIRSRQERALKRQLAHQRQRRQRRLRELRGAEPFCMGRKWGLRLGQRIVVPPIYRQVLPPVGLHCAFEQFPGRWGVMALDGVVVADARYHAVEFMNERRVELVLANGSSEVKEL